MSYFHPIYARNHTTLPGIGTIHTHSVGSTAHTTGIDHYFKAEGADRAITGSVRYAATIAEDGSVAWILAHVHGPSSRRRDWKLPRLTEETQEDFPAEVVSEMRRLSETLEERDPTDWFFHALGAVEMELDRLTARRQESERTIEHLGGLLADASEPRSHFVSAAEAGAPKGHFRIATPEERAERRALWERNLAKARAAIARFDEEKGARVAMLRRMRAALRTWSSSTKPRRLPSIVLRDAVQEPALAA